MSQYAIPSVDLKDFILGDETAKKQFVNALGSAFEEVGFISVQNPLVQQILIARYYEEVKRFFSLPKDVKRRYEIVGLGGQRGYTSFGKEHAKGSDAADLKEFWQMGQTVESENLPIEHYPDNIRVKELPDFYDLGVSLYKSFENTGRSLLRAIGIHLGIGEFYFDKHLFNGNSILRAIHYPPITNEPGSAIRAEQHEDINLITMLVGASAEGLQLLNRKNEWLDIAAPEGSLVVNVGDMLQRLTNNKLKSTTHRVVNPPREKWSLPRYSIPFFMHPRSEMPLDCLPSCVDEGSAPAYEPITAGEYLHERLVEIGLIPKSADAAK